MATAADDRQALVGRWRATPDDYSSIRVVRFEADGSGELTYAYGQTIYAIMPCVWEVPAAGRLRLTYAAPTGGRRAREGFALDADNRFKELGYTLTSGRVSGVESVVLTPYEYDRTLELSEPPWPSGLNLPYEVPRVFYGRGAGSSGGDA